MSELSTTGGPGGPGFRMTFQVVETVLEVPAAFWELTLTVKVAESHGIAVSQVLRESGVTPRASGKTAPTANFPIALLLSATTVQVPLEAGTAKR